MECIIKCPTCSKTVVYSSKNPNRPFCSERCRMIDLGEWLDEGYRIPDEEMVPGEDQQDDYQQDS